MTLVRFTPTIRFPVQCSVTYHSRSFRGQGTMRNFSPSGGHLSGDLPVRPRETLSLTVRLPNKQRIVVPETVVRWSRHQGFSAENIFMKPHTRTRRQHAMRQLVQESTEDIL